MLLFVSLQNMWSNIKKVVSVSNSQDFHLPGFSGDLNFPEPLPSDILENNCILLILDNAVKEALIDFKISRSFKAYFDILLEQQISPQIKVSIQLRFLYTYHVFDKTVKLMLLEIQFDYSSLSDYRYAGTLTIFNYFSEGGVSHGINAYGDVCLNVYNYILNRSQEPHKEFIYGIVSMIPNYKYTNL